MTTVLVVFLVAVGMVLVEQRFGARRFPALRGWWLRALLLNGVQVGAVFLGAVTWDRWLPGLVHGTFVDAALAVQVALAYLAITFVYYWWHRARHEIALLWRWLHQIHHSPARIEVITSFYKHPLEILLNGWLSAMILYLLVGVSPLAASLTVLITGLAELFYHWNIRTPYWLGFFFQRPESHCIHHQAGYHRNNYSDLPLWDMLFGTFENPRFQPEKVGFTPERESALGRMLLGHDLHAKKKESTL